VRIGSLARTSWITGNIPRARQGQAEAVGGGKEPFKSSSERDLDWAALLEIARLRQIDQMVRAHERAHLIAGGDLVLSGPHYVYKRGPDGRLYAVGGDVVIDASGVPGDPEATLRKAERIVRAALAPLNPSPQDLRVALRAQIMAMQARLELARQRAQGGKHAYRA